jgi:hypothetical protein
MKKRVINLSSQAPLLNIVSYGRGFHPLTPAQRSQITRTVRGFPEVVVKVSGGARSVAGVDQHVGYIGREGDLELETDMGARVRGRDAHRQVIAGWLLSVDALPRQTTRRPPVRKPPKLVHNLIFSMPPGRPSEKVLKAVQRLALNEWQLKHRYAMAMHTDDRHPHVHVVLKAISEEGERLNIKKATLRHWRSQFAVNLRELGVAANATERAVRGETKTRKRDSIYRAAQRGMSTHMRARWSQAFRSLPESAPVEQPGGKKLRRTRNEVLEGWRQVAANLRANGDHEVADQIKIFLGGMSPPLTELERFTERLREKVVKEQVREIDRTR